MKGKGSQKFWFKRNVLSSFSSLTKDRCYDFKNIFAEKFSEKSPFLTQNKAKLCKILIVTLVFEKNANFFAENCQKSQKIVIITSTPAVCFSSANLKKFVSVARVTGCVYEKIGHSVAQRFFSHN
jgi:hypothetical protein